MYYFLSLIPMIFLISCFPASAQNVRIVSDGHDRKIEVFIGDKLFTAFCYPDNIEKPFLFPVYAPDGSVITRGYPLTPRKGERVDHPHHIGLWFNHGNVNGLDFWNNSSVIPAEEKNKYGHIVVREILKAEGGHRGTIKITCDWVDNNGVKVLTEHTTYIFTGEKDLWTIDHISTLTASDTDVTITDSKEGMFAIRVDRAFEMPSNESLIFTDANGKPAEVRAADNTGVTGMYHSENGKSGDAVWGTRNKWVVLSAIKDNVPISMAIFDNPQNPGFPAYSHARGYGLFAVNNLGRKSYDPSQEQMIFKLAKGQSVRFVHRFCVQSGSEITTSEAEKIFESFSNEYK
jgi:Methane oxygenase PmoA